MTNNAEHLPGSPAPATGLYRQLNVLGTKLAIRVHAVEGTPLPGSPIGHVWRLEQEAEPGEPTA
jgi:hypothetical protein